MPKDVDWNALEDLAAKQGLSAVMVDGIEKLPDGQRPPQPVLLQWIGETLQGFEYRYELYRRAIAEIAGFYNSHGYKMMLLKGYACCLDWPKPEHRPCGDIDIWLFGKQKEADSILTKETKINVDKSHLHHTVFYWSNFMVENHYDIVETHSNKSNARIEKLFKDLAKDDQYSVDVYGEKVYLPSPNFHALFLLRHSVLHFNTDEMTIRHALDWGLFVKHQGKKINWKWLLTILDEYHMREFFNCLNAICVEDLGFETRIFPYVQFDPRLKDRILEDLLSPSLLDKEPNSLIRRVIFKYRRRKAREWKHDLCYKESMGSHLLSSLWLHVKHPRMI